MDQLYYLLALLIPVACIALTIYVIVQVRRSRNLGEYESAPVITKTDIGVAPTIKDKDPHEGKIVVARPLNRNQRRLLKKDAKKYYKKQGIKADDANAMAEQTIKTVVVDPVVARKRNIGAYS